MGLFDTVMNVATGGAYGVAVAAYDTAAGAVSGALGITSGSTQGAVASAVGAAGSSIPQVVPSSQQDPAIVQSNNMLEATRIQAMTMRQGIDASSKTSQFQMLAWTTQQLNDNDTKLQVATIQAKGEMSAQSDRHVEKMEELRLEGLELKRTLGGKGAGSPDIPEPDF